MSVRLTLTPGEELCGKRKHIGVLHLWGGSFYHQSSAVDKTISKAFNHLMGTKHTNPITAHDVDPASGGGGV